ncbi:hypothetical protein LTR62_008249 [Meristemomyces frigidus]|uniref:Uncharacterized protein n=1 Tax=Meristemomyces frigidus TaxID=1508187 RepID=A0AAN7T9Q3_9PEZI|nr:hypothetical protein LTR62_008249 [Meristemomyces frigidus]
MAFQQPQQRPIHQRRSSATKQDAVAQLSTSPGRKRLIEESQEWILFSPRQDEQSTTSQNPRTATDVGSLQTHVRSQQLGSADLATCEGTEEDDDDAELDSLDDGLHAFQHHPFSSSSHQLDHSGGAILPTHDGLGMFPSSNGLQEHLWQFERHNPHRRRHARRRSSIRRRLDEVEEGEEHDLQDERTARVEKWRLEQSKAVLEEIEREARRRHRRARSSSGEKRGGLYQSSKLRSDSVVEKGIVGETAVDQAASSTESWWQRLTRKVIQDLIGLDETTLSVIFGEDLPVDPSPTPTQRSPLAKAAAHESRVTFYDHEQGWEAQLIKRITRELDMLVNQIPEHETRAFNTYGSNEHELEYAGLPHTKPESSRRSIPRHSRRRPSASSASPAGQVLSDSLFSPTLQRPRDQADISVWGIENEPSEAPRSHEKDANANQEREYWERDIDVNMIFSYLRRRFSSYASPPLPPQPQTPDSNNTSGPLPASWATTTTPSAPFPRAEAIRRQHPLVSRAVERAAAQSRQLQRESLLRRHQMQSLLRKRGAEGEVMSSCASHSTKRSRHSRSIGLGGSERHYWLEGSGSVGSAVAGGGLGGWGEV